MGSVRTLFQATDPLRKKDPLALYSHIAADGVVTEHEVEMMRTATVHFHCPMPARSAPWTGGASSDSTVQDTTSGVIRNTVTDTSHDSTNCSPTGSKTGSDNMPRPVSISLPVKNMIALPNGAMPMYLSYCGTSIKDEGRKGRVLSNFPLS